MQSSVFKCFSLCLLPILLFSAHRIIHQSATLRGSDASVLVSSKTSAVLASRSCQEEPQAPTQQSKAEDAQHLPVKKLSNLLLRDWGQDLGTRASTALSGYGQVAVSPSCLNSASVRWRHRCLLRYQAVSSAGWTVLSRYG